KESNIRRFHLQPKTQSLNMVSKRNYLPYTKPLAKNKQELLQHIERHRQVLGAYCQRLSQQREEDSAAAAPANDAAPPVAPAPQRNSYDLFFESACISVKSLPPKLAAEAKSRISQIITEFEIRAISQEEEQLAAQRNRQQRLTGESIVDDATGIVYEFHPCP
ncbi:hypothetical protein KR009_007539, partial [Drosophila setifemur]